jgi:20S proteasome alpha/beta subunit
MTLIAAFRGRNGGILLCSDREENDGYSKRAVDKIYRIRDFLPCEVFIAGAGPTSVITNTCTKIHEVMSRATKDSRNILAEHQLFIEHGLKESYVKYARELKQYPMGLIIVVASREVNVAPILYRTQKDKLVPENLYASDGSGKTIADYLSDRLYIHGMYKDALVFLASFIFREAGESSCGVGLGTDMIFINEESKTLHFLYPDAVKEIESHIPSLKDSVHEHWKNVAVVPAWLVSDSTPSTSRK